MPGLIRGVARTAAVVGTASAVNGRVQRHQQQKFSAQDQAAYDAQQAQYAPPPQQYAPPPPQPQYAPPPVQQAAPPADDEDDPIAQIQRLGELNKQGILTDEEFAAAKAKLLGI